MNELFWYTLLACSIAVVTLTILFGIALVGWMRRFEQDDKDSARHNKLMVRSRFSVQANPQRSKEEGES